MPDLLSLGQNLLNLCGNEPSLQKETKMDSLEKLQVLMARECSMHVLSNPEYHALLPSQESPDCHNCKNSELAPFSGHHLSCNKPVVTIAANAHGVKNGWCMYPVNFDPIWLVGECKNYEPIKSEQAAEKATQQTAEEKTKDTP
jgi:hypothetical protein